jgi:glycerol-3-phosphate dehydrogenase
MHDVIIIGAGVVGTSIGRELSRYKLNLAVIEQEIEPAFGVSKSNSGIIHPGTQNPPDSIKGNLCVQGNRLTRKLAAELGVDFQQVGELIVSFDDNQTAQLQLIKKDAELLGVPGLQIVDRNWLHKNEPNLSKEVVAALYAPTAGIISPYRLVYDLAENAVRNGAELYTSTKVLNIIKKSAYEFETVTSAGTFHSRYVINCAGLHADTVSAFVSVTDFKIMPRKGEEYLLDKKKGNVTNHLIFPLPTKTSKGILVIKTADGNPMVGPTATDVDDKTDLSTSDIGMKTVFESVKKMVPSINENDIIAYFAGLRPIAGKDFIIRHEPDVTGFINVAGIQSPGLTAAPAIALMVAGILKTNGLTLTKKIFFHKHRKKTVHLFSVPVEKTKRLIKKNKEYGDIVCRCELVSAKEIKDAIDRGACTLDGIKFRTRAQAGRCHGSYCTTRLMKILAEQTKTPVTKVSKRGPGSEIVVSETRLK